MKGCDFAWLPQGIDLEAFARDLKRQGFGFVVRYLSYDPSKNLSREEVRAYRKHGLDIVTVWEGGAQAMLQGARQGQADAAAAKSQLRDLGAPAHAPVYFAADFAVTPEQIPVIDAYLDATAFELTQDLNGVYGSYLATGAHHVRYRWQTVAWSDGKWRRSDVLVQPGINSGSIAGVSWDLDDSKAADFGQWKWADVHAKPPRPKKHRVRHVARKVHGGAKKEPVLTAGSIAGVLSGIATFVLPHLGLHLTAKELSSVLTAIVALSGAMATVMTRPARVGAFTAALAAITTAAATFGLHMPAHWLGAEMPLASMLVGLLLRGHVSPAAGPAANAASAPAAAPVG